MDRGCCGTGKLEVAVLCNPLDSTCSNASEYVFWDSYHPTEGVYRKLVSHVLKKYMNQLFWAPHIISYNINKDIFRQISFKVFLRKINSFLYELK